VRGAATRNWRFEQIVRRRAPPRRDGLDVLRDCEATTIRTTEAAPEEYNRLRPRLVETLLDYRRRDRSARSYAAADDPVRLAAEKQKLEALAGPIAGHRYHYLRADPHGNSPPLRGRRLPVRHDARFPDAVGYPPPALRARSALELRADEPLDLVEVPLAAMDATLAERALPRSGGEARRARS